MCTSPACGVDDFFGTALDLVDIDPIESYARPLRSFESFLNASAKLTYIRSIAINDKEKKEKTRNTIECASFDASFRRW